MSKESERLFNDTVAGQRQFSAGFFFLVAIFVSWATMTQGQVVVGLVAGVFLLVVAYKIAPNPDTLPKKPTLKQIHHAWAMGIDRPRRYTRAGLSNELSERCGADYDDQVLLMEKDVKTRWVETDCINPIAKWLSLNTQAVAGLFLLSTIFQLFLSGDSIFILIVIMPLMVLLVVWVLLFWVYLRMVCNGFMTLRGRVIAEVEVEE